MREIAQIGLFGRTIHHLSQTEIGGDNPCSQQLSEGRQFPIAALIVRVEAVRSEMEYLRVT